MHEIEALNQPLYADDPTPWYAISRDRSGQTTAMSGDFATEEAARRELLAVLDGRD